MSDKYETFKTLLNKELQFPAKYLHKFIGANTGEFLNAVSEFEKRFTGLHRTGEKLSSSSAHISLTYEYHAATAEDVVHLTIETQKIPGVLYIL